LFAVLVVVGVLDVVVVLGELPLALVEGLVVLAGGFVVAVDGVVVLVEELPVPDGLLVVAELVDLEEVGPGSGSQGTDLFGIVPCWVVV
jgi:hypothetical protein